MKTVLFFKSSELQSCRKKLAGVTSVACRFGWNVQSVEPVRTEETAQQLLGLWKPDGCIVSCGAKTNSFSSSVFGSIPLVFIDRPNEALTRGDSCVYHDSTATANAAARELLSLNFRHYAYANWPVPDEVAVIGIDNDEDLCESSVPSLSSVEPDFFRSGVMAAEILNDLMARRTHRPIRMTYPPLRLVRRESTRCLPKCDKAVSDALELIRRESCNGLAARDVFRMFPCSRRMAELRFRAATGRSVLEEIRGVRLEKAKELLAGPPLKLEAVANFCGYKSAVAFSIFFKAETGETPSAWKNTSKRLNGTQIAAAAS